VTDEARVVNAVVGRHVRRAINETGCNLRAAAERAGLSYRSVLRYMSGERDMPVPVLLALVEASSADLTDLMRQLEADLHPNLTPPASTVAPAETAQRAPIARQASSVAGEDVESAVTALHSAQLELDRRMQELGVTRLAARSIGPIDATELLAIADVVQEIVQELRDV
jgi:hypothetical protein